MKMSMLNSLSMKKPMNKKMMLKLRLKKKLAKRSPSLVLSLKMIKRMQKLMQRQPKKTRQLSETDQFLLRESAIDLEAFLALVLLHERF